MRTRTLLILAVVCGLAILVAGGIQLLRVSDDGGTSNDLAIGDHADAADLGVTVLGAHEQDGLLTVEVRIGGVDDADGLDGFHLVVSGDVLEPLSPQQAGAGACDGVTVAEQTCSLVFGTADVTGRARVLLLRRGEDQRRWTLA